MAQPLVVLTVIALAVGGSCVGPSSFDGGASDGGVASLGIFQFATVGIYPGGARRAPLVIATNAVDDAGVAAWMNDIPVERIERSDAGGWWWPVPPGTSNGEYVVRVQRKADGAQRKLNYAIHDSGTYRWSSQIFNVLHAQCVGPIGVPSGLRKVCTKVMYDAGTRATIHVQHYVSDPAAPRFAAWEGGATGNDTFIEAQLAWSPREKVLVQALQTHTYTELRFGHPEKWRIEEVRMDLEATLDFTTCGLAVWHGQDEAQLLVTSRDSVRLSASKLDRFMGLPGPFADVVIPSGVPPCGLTTADLDGDGTDEVIVTSAYASGMAVYVGTPEVGFKEASNTWGDGPRRSYLEQEIASVGDLDDDGRLDIATTHGLGNVDILFQDDGLRFTRAVLAVEGSFNDAATIARLDADHAPYLLVGDCAEGTAPCVFRMHGRGEPTREDWRIALAPFGARYPMLDFDLDGDGLRDLVGGDYADILALWRRPDHEDEDGRHGPRPITYISNEDLRVLLGE